MQRRNLFRLAAAGCAVLSVPTLRAAQSKSIVIIYSRTGSTEQLARWIAEETKSDYLKLELVEPYAESYGAMTNIARDDSGPCRLRHDLAWVALLVGRLFGADAHLPQGSSARRQTRAALLHVGQFLARRRLCGPPKARSEGEDRRGFLGAGRRRRLLARRTPRLGEKAPLSDVRTQFMTLKRASAASSGMRAAPVSAFLRLVGKRRAVLQ